MFYTKTDDCYLDLKWSVFCKKFFSRLLLSQVDMELMHTDLTVQLVVIYKTCRLSSVQFYRMQNVAIILQWHCWCPYSSVPIFNSFPIMILLLKNMLIYSNKLSIFSNVSVRKGFIMAALHNRCRHYIFVLHLSSSSWFFPCLISAVGDWMSTILPHMVWP